MTHPHINLPVLQCKCPVEVGHLYSIHILFESLYWFDLYARVRNILIFQCFVSLISVVPLLYLDSIKINESYCTMKFMRKI